MYDIFAKEEEVLKKAEELADSGVLGAADCEGHYRKLLGEYRSLLAQVRRMVKLSDLMESRLNGLSQEKDQLSKVDFLTNLYNRRFFDEYFRKKWRGCISSNEFLSMLMIDIDYFKLYNDMHGHIEGDKCLQALAAKILDLLEPSKYIAARFGGEEFVVLLPGTGIAEALEIAEGLRVCIEAAELPLEGGDKAGRITVSIGVSGVLPCRNIAADALIKAADAALYMAKKDGRNCTRQIEVKEV